MATEGSSSHGGSPPRVLPPSGWPWSRKVWSCAGRAANSAAILSHPRGWKGAVRPGLALYGLHPSEKVDRADLRPVLAFETAVIEVRNVPEGGTVGYGGAWRAARASRVAILPVGYAD